jgi:hypothetical protein
MDKFPNVDIGFPSQNITDCMGVEPYNIYNEYIFNPCINVINNSWFNQYWCARPNYAYPQVPFVTLKNE